MFRLEDVNSFREFLFKLVLKGQLWELELVWEEFHGVGDSCAAGFGEIASVVPVVFHSWTHIETPTGVFIPRVPFTGSVVDSNLAPGG